MFLSPRLMPAVFSFAAIAPCSASYSTNARPRRPGTNLTSRKPSKRPKTVVSSSTPYSSGIFCRKRILFGGRYSSGMTAAAAVLVDLSPDGFEAFAGRPSAAAAAPRLSWFSASTALRLSVKCHCQCLSGADLSRTPYLSLQVDDACAHRVPPRCLPARWSCHF